MHRCFSLRCFSPCCSLPLFVGLLFFAIQGYGGARDTLILAPEPAEVAKPEVAKPEVAKPEVVKPEVVKPEVAKLEGAEAEGVELLPGAEPAPLPGGGLLGEKPVKGEGEESVEIPIDEGFVGPLPEDGLPPEGLGPFLPNRLPIDDVLEDDLRFADPLGRNDLFSGEPDAFKNLDIPLGPIGIRGLTREGETFDSEFLRNEFRSGGFHSPMDRQGARFGLGMDVGYDSNIFLDETNEVSDFIFTLAPSVEYRSAPAGVPGLFEFRYTPFVRFYVAETDQNTVDHSANTSLRFAGARGEFETTADYSRFAYADRVSGGQRETETFYASANASYQIASRTTLEASLFGRTTKSSNANSMMGAALRESDDRMWQIQLAAFWAVTERTRFGPSVRHSRSESRNFGNYEASAVLMVVDYEPREELTLNAALGFERSKGDSALGQPAPASTGLTGDFGVIYSPNDRVKMRAELSYSAIPRGRNRSELSGGGAENLTGVFSILYTPNPQWSMGFDVTADAFPSKDTVNYSVSNQDYHAVLTRHFSTGALSLEGTLGNANYESVGTVAMARSDEAFRSLALRYRLPVLVERGSLSSSIRWSENTGNRDWERVQVGLGMDMAF